MGKGLSTITKPVGGLAGGIIGSGGGLVNKVLSPFGLGGEQGEYAQGNFDQSNKALTDYNKFLGDYAGERDLATKGVQTDALTSGLYGAGGLQSQLEQENRDLSSRGFQLQQPDHEAYGQVSGDISRLFGQQEQQASQSLARRGLASASSGAAGATFSGLAGNKNEMLANSQMQIAQKRMADTQQRLAQTRSMMSSLAGQGTNMAQQRYNDKGAGLKDRYTQSANQEDRIYGAERNMLSDKDDAKGETLFGSLGKGIASAATKAPTAILGKASGQQMFGGSGGGTG